MWTKTTPPKEAPKFTPPNWSGDVAVQLEALRVYAEASIQWELEWYYRRKKGRAVASRYLRLAALLLTVLGGLVPVAIAVFQSRPAWRWLENFDSVRFAQLGYLFLAIAGGLFLIDKYFGFSTGWIRYILAVLAIEKSREGFRIDWAALSRKLAAAKPDSAEFGEAVERMIQRIRAVIVEVKEHSEKETQAWITEFQTSLSQFEKDVQAKTEATRPGGIDVEVTDGKSADGGVELSLDGMIAERFSGTAGSIGYVAPGLHRVTAKATKGGRDFVASQLVTVGGNQIAQVKLTLGM